MDLTKIRDGIDAIDCELVRLITKRMEYAIRAKRFKSDVVDTSREETLLHRIDKLSHGLLDKSFSLSLFKDLMKESVRLQELEVPLVAFFGEHGSYGEIAISKYDKNWLGIPVQKFSEIFEAVNSGAVDYGIVPTEHALEGGEREVEDLLISSDLKIVAALRVPITHALVTLKETGYRDIKDVYSTPTALAQCSGFLKRNKLTPRSYYDSAAAALMLREIRLPGAAAIASSYCAEIHDLQIIKEEIEDHPGNYSKFLVLSKARAKERGERCIVVFSLDHQSGMLIQALEAFSERRINLTRITSKNVQNDENKILFLVEFEGEINDPKIEGALANLEKITGGVKVLGCFREFKYS